MNMHYKGIKNLSKALKSKDISVQELHDFYLQRQNRLAAELNCLINTTPEIALSQIKSAQKLINTNQDMKINAPVCLAFSNDPMEVNPEERIKKLNITLEELFLKQDVLINKKVKEISDIDIDFSNQKLFLEQQFIALKELAKQTDVSFIGAVKAQEIKQLKGLNNLEKRLLKAQKYKLSDEVLRLKNLQNELFPNQSLEERTKNFSEMYLLLGEDLIPLLMEALNPLQMEFSVIEF